jgi:hypothetical protein
VEGQRHEVAEEQEKTLKPLWPKGFLLVEHRRFELLTPTLPVMRLWIIKNHGASQSAYFIKIPYKDRSSKTM